MVCRHLHMHIGVRHLLMLRSLAQLSCRFLAHTWSTAEDALSSCFPALVLQEFLSETEHATVDRPYIQC